MRPDRLLIGEIRGAEAEDLLTSLNTGHDGGMCSLPSNNVRDSIGRIEVMVLMSHEELPIPVIRRQIASGVEILVHLSRDAAGARQLSEIAEITGMDGNEVQIRTLFARDQEGVLRKKNTLTRTGKLEKLYERKGGKYQR